MIHSIKLQIFFNVTIDYLLGRSESSEKNNNNQPDLEAPLREKSRAEALQRISELDSEFNVPDEVLLDLIRQVRNKFGAGSKENDSESGHGRDYLKSLEKQENIDTLKSSEAQLPKVKEIETEYHPELEELVPRDEANLPEAIIKISELVYTHSLTKEDVNYLMQRAVDHYGKLEFPEETYEAAHGPQIPGQIDWNKKEEE